MKVRRRRCAAVFAAVAAFVALCAAWLIFLLSGSGDEGRADATAGKTFLEVRLANRTIRVPRTVNGGVPQVAATMPPILSRRGTAPFVLVANGRATAEVRRRATACGARVSGVIPPHGLVVEADATAISRLGSDGAFAAAEPLAAEDKMSESLKSCLVAGAEGELPVTVVPLRAEDADAVAEGFRANGVEPTEVSREGRGRVRAKVPSRLVASIAARGDVRWVERHVRPRLLNNVAVRPGLMNVTPVRDMYGLTGKGQTITVSDSGLDTGRKSTVMADFANRVALIKTVSGCLMYDQSGHGTHVAGSIAGNGALSGGEFKGVAYEANLNVWQCMDSSGDLCMPECARLFQPDLDRSPSYIHSGSWGGGINSEYDSYCIDVDLWMWEHPVNLSVFAVGNKGAASTVLSPAGAKNVIAVGATESLRTNVANVAYADNPSQIAYFSSKGPMADGRIKPDVCAPGSYIISTRGTMATGTGWGLYGENSSYMYDAGTSMAAPLVSGSAALVRQWLIERRGYSNEMPTAALIKAVLMGGAYDMAHDAGTNCGGAAPNSSQGWGRVDLGESLYPTNASVKLVDRIPFADGETFSVRVATTNMAPLSVQLVWTDYPGEYGAAQALVNDLDLVVSNETTGAVWFGNGVGGGDRTNSVESVRIASAESATYCVQVRGACIPYDSAEGGAAALYVRGALDMADATNVPETVRLTVSVEGPSPGATTPAPGVYRITKGVPITLSAENIICKEIGEIPTWQRMVAGWTGSGDVPASGASGRTVVSLSQDSDITWRWNGFTNVLLCSYMFLPNYKDNAIGYVDSWPRLGEVVELAVPESTPVGSETYDITSLGAYYVDEDGSSKRLRVQRLGRIETAETDSEQCYPVVDGNGHMATRFSLAMDDSVDVLYYYFDEGSTNVATSLPTWWHQRYVSENPNADDVRFTMVSPERLEWVGGAGLRRVLERTPRLGVAADWQPVYTNAPAPVLTNLWEVPTAFSTNSFYRIVW